MRRWLQVNVICQDDIQMERNVKIYMEDCELVGDKIYFFSRDWNGLYILDYKSKEIKLIGIMPEEHILSRRLCAGIVHCHEMLVLVPMTAKKIWIYSLENRQWRGLERKYVTENDCCKEIFRAIKYKEYLFFIGSNYPAIIRMNIETYNLEYLTEPYNFLESKKNPSECYFISDYAIQNNYLLVASCLNNYVLQLNMDTFEFEWFEVGNKDYCYSGIAWDGEYYWLSPRRGTPIVKWDGKAKAEYYFLPEGFDNTIYNFLGIQYHNGKLIFPGMMQDKTLIADVKSLNDVEVRREQYTFFRCSKKDGELSQTVDGLLRLKLFNQNEQYDVCVEIQKSELMDWYINREEKQYYGEKENRIRGEFSVLSLPLCIALLDKKKDMKHNELKIGVNIWKNVLS